MNKKVLVLVSLLYTPLMLTHWQDTGPCACESCPQDKCVYWQLFGGPTFYKACQDGLDYAITSTQTTRLDEADVREPNFKYKTGFELGVGMYLPEHQIDVVLKENHLESHARDSYASNSENVFSTWSIPGTLTAAKTGAADWHLRFDMFDGEVGGLVFPSQNIHVRVYGGLKAVRIDQKYDLLFTGGRSTGPAAYVSTNAIAMENKFRGAGPRVGCYLRWETCSGIGFYANVAFSALTGKCRIAQRETITYDGAVVEPEHLELYDSYQRLRPAAETAIGLSWELPFNSNGPCFTIMAEWDGLVFWGQNQLRKLVNANNWANVKSDYDLALYGPKLGIRGEF